MDSSCFKCHRELSKLRQVPVKIKYMLCDDDDQILCDVVGLNSMPVYTVVHWDRTLSVVQSSDSEHFLYDEPGIVEYWID